MKPDLWLPFVLGLPSLVCAESTVPGITWNTPSADSLDSMPLSGRMGAGANVWVQEGSIWLYLAHNGAYDESGRLLKVGCIRLTPKALNLGGEGFVQELDPNTGAITIRQGDFNATLWFAGETLVYESASANDAPMEVAYGTWREKTKDGIRNDMMGAKTTFTGDQVTASKSGFLWFHRNDDHPADLAALARSQGSRPESLPEKTTAGRISGAAVCVDGGMSQPVESEARWQFWNGKAWTGTTPARRKHLVTMRLEGEVGADPMKWPAEAKKLLDGKTREAAKADELKRWDEFWSRSHVVINPEAGEKDPGFLIGRNYQLFRYMQAANRDGELPLLFNGGIFTTDNGGTLSLQSACLDDSSTVSIASGAVLELPHGLTDTVAGLIVNGTTLPSGTYNAGSPATNGYITGTGSIQVGPSDPFLAWIDATWPSLSDKTEGGDPDHDGMSNLLEYVLKNGDPSVSNPVIVPTADASGSNFIFTFYRRNASTVDTTQTFEFGTDLDGWTSVSIPGGAGVTVTDQGSGIDKVVVSVAKGSNTSLFGRLKVVK